jgi:aminoglycoside 6-adenylyltransferase
MKDPQSEFDAIPAIIQWADAHDAIRAVLLTSNRAIPGAEVDAQSDYDVVLVMQDIHPFVDDHSWLGDFGEVLIAYWDPIYPDPAYGVERCGNVTQYVDGLKIDFNLWPVALLQQIVARPGLPAELDAGYRVLLDKDHLTDGLPPPSGKAYVPTPPTLLEYQTLVNDFLSDAPYVARYLWRDELMPAKWCLDYDMKHSYLQRMLEWRVEMDHHWSIRVGWYGKGLKKLLPAEIWIALEHTYTGASLADNWKALWNTMQLFRQVSVEVANHLGYSYPEELHQRVCTYVKHIMHMNNSSSNGK